MGLFGNIFRGQSPSGLGVSAGRLAPCPQRPNCVSSQAAAGPRYIEPLRTRLDPAGAMARLRAVLTDLGGSVVTEEVGYLRAEFASRLWGFVDDVDVLCVPSDGENLTVIHMRSASRLGYWDMGVNRRRLEALRRRFGAGAE